MKSSDVNTLDPKYGLRFVVRRSHLRDMFHFDLILRHCEFATISTASNDALHQASLWIDERLNEHPNHHSTMSTQSYKPTRFIDVSPNTESWNPRLHRTSPEEVDLKYTTLSHCWGNTNTLKLLKINYAQLRSGLEINDLPQTYRDAILITRRLGYKYIWIDSLCIFQDSPEDWNKEASTMSSVYSKSTVTIAATWGQDSDAGCYVARNPLLTERCRHGESSGYTVWSLP